MIKIINTQEEFDKLTEVKKEDEIIVECEVRLNSILNVYGKITFKRKTDCTSCWGGRYIEARGNSSVVAWENSSVEARGNSSVVAWGNSSVEARGNSSVEAWGNSSVVAWGNSSVEAWGNSSVEARGNSSVVAWENSSVVAWGNSSVEARGNSSVEAWGNSSVVAWENSSVEAWGNSCIRLFSGLSKVVLNGFSVLFKDIDLKVKFKIKKSITSIIQNTTLLPFIERDGIKEIKGKVVLYKKVSKDFKTQEGKVNETIWEIGKIVKHKNYNPEKEECGEGKFHACSRPYFCDEFRNEKGDRYIAVEINKKDLFEWKNNPTYPHKIAFRKCKVLYECNKTGVKI